MKSMAIRNKKIAGVIHLSIQNDAWVGGILAIRRNCFLWNVSLEVAVFCKPAIAIPCFYMTLFPSGIAKDQGTIIRLI